MPKALTSASFEYKPSPRRSSGENQRTVPLTREVFLASAGLESDVCAVPKSHIIE